MNSSKNYIDTLCIGFGPAGLALACVFNERHGERGDKTFLALEKAESCAWHPNLILDNTDINHHVYRDLVTPRNPQSPYSFAMYLKEKNRLYKFGLLGRPASRFEWSDYMGWVAQKLNNSVRYNSAVTDVSPILENGILMGFTVKGYDFTYTTKKLVLSNGSSPHIPKVYHGYLGSHVFHASEYLERLHGFGENVPKRWLVLGSGQSAGEIIVDLIGKKNDIHITSLHRSVGFKIAQLGQFPNLVFLPESIEYFKRLDNSSRERFFNHIKNTNYSGIDTDESQYLYSMIYEDEIKGRERIKILNNSELLSLSSSHQGGYHIVTQDSFTGELFECEVDAIALGTGYQQPTIPALLAPLEQFLVKDPDGKIIVDNDYKIKIKDCDDVHVYVNGLSERTHGISDAQSFSAVAFRAGVIYESIQSDSRASIDYFI
ncbi:SidA/IucD/PvdA family monooxygenase [Serratia rubidaea]|nr:SidA/IucD/PvdA family monooxygenase [Serratia rubidaea]